jgi:hypothetical protein
MPDTRYQIDFLLASGIWYLASKQSIIMDKSKLAVIHIVKKELKLSDEEYRKILKEAAGVRSAKDLDERGFRKLMRYFVRSRHYRINPLGLTLKQKLYIKFLASQMNWDKDHINNFIHKYYHRLSLDVLSRKEARNLIESLKNVMRHKEES